MIYTLENIKARIDTQIATRVNFPIQRAKKIASAWIK